SRGEKNHICFFREPRNPLLLSEEICGYSANCCHCRGYAGSLQEIPPRKSILFHLDLPPTNNLNNTLSLSLTSLSFTCCVKHTLKVQPACQETRLPLQGAYSNLCSCVNNIG